MVAFRQYGYSHPKIETACKDVTKPQFSGYADMWDINHPAISYATPGALPTPRDGVVPATACFDYGGGLTCVEHAPIAVLHCGAFLLWRLPDAPACPLAYCAAPSGLFGG